MPNPKKRRKIEGVKKCLKSRSQFRKKMLEVFGIGVTFDDIYEIEKMVTQGRCKLINRFGKGKGFSLYTLDFRGLEIAVCKDMTKRCLCNAMFPEEARSMFANNRLPRNL